MQVDLKGNKITWLGHATFKIETATGKTVLIDPWVMNNPKCPEKLKKLDKVDLMLVTHAHGDHIGDAVEIGKKHSPKVVGIYELTGWLKKKGVENCSPMNKGGTQEVEGVKVTMVEAQHSCGIEDEGAIIYGGEACGYVLQLPGGLRIYHAGDTNVFGDMAIIRELYRPELAMLPIGDHFTMGPDEAAYACGLLKAKTVIPMHFGTFPMLTGTVADLRARVKEIAVEVIEPEPGMSWS